MTEKQLEVMRSIEEGKHFPDLIKEHTGRTQQDISRTLVRLLDIGLVDVEMDRFDMRRRRYSITELGKIQLKQG